MLRNVLHSGLVGALLTLSLVTTVFAVDGDPIFAQVATLTQTYVNQIQDAQAATDLATLQARTRTALATGDQLVAVLNQAIASATTDADRSRAQGLLDHIEAAQASGQRVLTATSLDVARSNLDAMRGEAVEALAEVPPVVTPTPTPGELPMAGEPGSADLLTVAGAALALTLGGIGLRRVRLA